MALEKQSRKVGPGAKAKEPDDKLEATLFKAADKMRGAVDPAEYKYVALGLIFLRYLSIAFETKHAQLEADPEADENDPEEYIALGVFWVPEEARWSEIQRNAPQPDIGVRIDNAMRAIENEAKNKTLKGVLPKVFAGPQLTREMLAGLVNLFTNELKLTGARGDFDILGRVYEYFLGKFAGAEGKSGGEFYTPGSIVGLAVEMIEPTKGRVYDPCCGTGGFFVQSDRFIEAHRGQLGDIAIYGQERNQTTLRLAKMNLAIRGIDAHLEWNAEGTLVRDAFPDQRFDYALANPPFNVSDWSGEQLRDDKRWKLFGAPPPGNANFAWLQHVYHHLAPAGVAAIVLANGSMSSQQGGEGDIRSKMIVGDAVDCIVSLPPQIFYGTQIPACLWILAKDRSGRIAGDGKSRDRRGEVFFVDARKLGHMVDRTRKEFSSVDIDKITRAYHAWRGNKDVGLDESVLGFCKAASLEEIKGRGYILNPGRYVGTEDVEVDDVSFEERLARLIHRGSVLRAFASRQGFPVWRFAVQKFGCYG